MNNNKKTLGSIRCFSRVVSPGIELGHKDFQSFALSTEL